MTTRMMSAIKSAATAPARKQPAPKKMSAFRALEDSIDNEDPLVYAALVNLRIATAEKLRAFDLSAELTKEFSLSVPLLPLAQYLGIDEEKLRKLNSIPDSFVIGGDVIYV